MKKLLLLLCAAFALIGSANAQTSLVATLSHEGQLSTFYSANAFKDAYEAAFDGDVITLSPGNFASPTTIEKSLTVRGAGMMGNSTTTISNKITLNNKGESNLNSTFEGLYFISSVSHMRDNTNFIKCRFKSLSSSSTTNCKFIHSIIDAGYISSGGIVMSNCCFYGSNLLGATNISNCYINSGNNGIALAGTTTNCIFESNSNGNITTSSSGTFVKNCIYIGPSSTFYTYSSNSLISEDNRSFAESTPIFKEGTKIYELTDENKAAWIGSDGTEIGMHGGNLPFDPTTSNPQVTKFNVAPKTTADGKLSVDIEVKTY